MYGSQQDDFCGEHLADEEWIIFRLALVSMPPPTRELVVMLVGSSVDIHSLIASHKLHAVDMLITLTFYYYISVFYHCILPEILLDILNEGRCLLVQAVLMRNVIILLVFICLAIELCLSYRNI